MTTPKIADTKPVLVELQAGKQYWFCRCGLSKGQPYCDGSHQGTGTEPLAFSVDEDRQAALCMCKRTHNPPFCDGAHSTITADDLEAGAAPAQVGGKLQWHKVMEKDELPEGRVKTAACEGQTLCMTRFKGEYGALDNACPHQGGPLGEGSIENGLLRCPWHGWDFDPLTGKAPGYDDGVETFEVEVREDGVYVGLPRRKATPAPSAT